MKILAISKMNPSTKRENIESLQKEEAQMAWSLYRKGIIRELYFSVDPPAAVLILESDDLLTAQKTLADLPLVKKGLINFDFYVLGPFHTFEALFHSKINNK